VLSPQQRSLLKDRDAWWTVLVVDPVAVRVTPPLARLRSVTPNRLTAFAIALGVGTVALFATGNYVAGALVYQLRFIVDCLDGKVARLRGTSSALGAAFDVCSDVLVVTASFAALAVRVDHDGPGSTGLTAAIVGSSMVFAWIILYRKGLTPAPATTTEPRPAGATAPKSLPRRYAAWMTAHRLFAVPYAVEAEVLALSICPVTGSPRVAAWGLYAAAVFYVVATFGNLARIAILAARRDAATTMLREHASVGE
jgi:phosphatidylglycerophosphate synthase